MNKAHSKIGDEDTHSKRKHVRAFGTSASFGRPRIADILFSLLPHNVFSLFSRCILASRCSPASRLDDLESDVESVALHHLQYLRIMFVRLK